MMKFVLITRERCPHCSKVTEDFLPKYRELLESVAPFSHVHFRNIQDLQKIPVEIRSHVKVVPQLYTIYNDGSFNATNPLEIPNVSKWMQKTIHEADGKKDPKMTLLVLMSESCGNCTKWKASGEYKKFIDSQSKRYKGKLHIYEFNIEKEKSGIVREAITGMPTPFLVLLPYSLWKKPTSVEEVKKNLHPEVADPQSPEGRIVVQKWLDILISDEGLEYYMVLATSDSCPHCRNWRSSGGEAEFKRKFSDLDGILLVHNGIILRGVRSLIPHVPSVMMVPKKEWMNANPRVIHGPQPQDIEAVNEWVFNLMKEKKWKNGKEQVPDDFIPPPGISQKTFPVRQRIR